MYEISINHKGVGKTYYTIYTKDEAENEGVEYKYWKEAKKGDYALSDDNYVAKVIQHREYESNMPFILLSIPLKSLLPRVGNPMQRFLANHNSK